MSVQIRVLTEYETIRKRKENRARQNYKGLYRENQKITGLYVQERTITRTSKGGNNNIQALVMNQKRPTTQEKQQTTRKQQ